ncbi:hypothetical protein BU24DRAFT_162414 [Aaosphaeria arxii CBS 175.79]|uniref:Zn(2)-C6 fungal-type domain-containing protein n=1 Tax=Aaosphaeria arxii CBS 175.79 TaxID=1450172 RepID=A0A6A5XYF2_9PLEO|nr:uncharacterized protein BU24DRAFT_162414 [Aaosphaeria arxii CBS 175.79]KAF2017953.1 hypothetical protein BU24DRAFT_162414 [Aaosphaeria arxii CBS 175.79]
MQPRSSNTSLFRRNASHARKRTANACKRCRQHKIKCTGIQPCAHCERRKITCVFDEKSEKVIVTRGWLSDLERQAAHASRLENTVTESQGTIGHERGGEHDTGSPTPASQLGIDDPSESSELGDSNTDVPQPPQQFTNYLVTGPSFYYSPTSINQSYYLGTSSNWSFGRRVLILAHNKVFGDTSLPHEILHFDGSSYELGWDGRKTGTETGGQPILPIGEYARFLIGAVKYHCGQLFHLFDENDFMDKFEKLQRNDNDGPDTSDLWYIHYLLILALGKALLGQTEGRRPPGAELFVHAMKLLPSMIYLWTQPIESTEILCCTMIYLQCLDLRIVAYNYIGQAMRIAITNGWHTDIPSQHFAPDVLERCRRIWWTVYTLDCHMSVLQGTPIPLNEWNISSQLPNFGGSEKESRALRMHVKLAKIIAFIQQTVYRIDDSADGYFLKSIKTTLKYLAKVNDERAIEFPLKIDDSSHSISRLSAHFYLFHHQAIILAIKPLLFFFFKRRLEASKRIRIPTAGGVRALARIGVGSAQQIMKTLAALRTQDLLGIVSNGNIRTLPNRIL